jgi:hypothetical protein
MVACWYRHASAPGAAWHPVQEGGVPEQVQTSPDPAWPPPPPSHTKVVWLQVCGATQLSGQFWPQPLGPPHLPTQFGVQEQVV